MKIRDLKGGEKVIPTKKLTREQWGVCTFIEREDKLHHKDDGIVVVEDELKHRHFINSRHLRLEE